MLKRVISVFMLFALISSNLSRFYVYAGFELNRSYIAEKLCVNKARPWMHCNGKCYFMKKIKQAEENEKKQESKNNLNKLEISFFQETSQTKLFEPNFEVGISIPFPAYNYRHSNHYLDAIFRPPKSIA